MQGKSCLRIMERTGLKFLSTSRQERGSSPIRKMEAYLADRLVQLGNLMIMPYWRDVRQRAENITKGRGSFCNDFSDTTSFVGKY